MAEYGAFIQTYTGKQFYPLAPRIKDVDILDIAHALSLITRFTGHTREFYSVAQHSVEVSERVLPVNALQALLHDASEAYLADLASPVKHSPTMSAYRNAEHHLQVTVFEAFGLRASMSDDIHIADRRMLATEARDLMNNPSWVTATPYPEQIIPLIPGEAEELFLNRFKELSA